MTLYNASVCLLTNSFLPSAAWNPGPYNSVANTHRREVLGASGYMRPTDEAAARSVQTSLRAQDGVGSPASDDASEGNSTNNVSRIGHVLVNGRYVTFEYEVGELPLRNSLTLSVYVRLTVSAEGVQQEIY
jgi:hypothetical protein